MNNPLLPIVIPVFQRTLSLSRLLSALEKAHYPEKKDIPLILSIEGNSTEEVISLVKNYHWPRGEKKLIWQEQRLGLERHLLFCGSLAKKYGSVILFEDDLFAGPGFYEYATKALQFYSGEERIAGISLYHYTLNNYTKLPFFPLIEPGEVYFLQKATTWGEAFTGRQWENFEHWWEKNREGFPGNKLLVPKQVKGYPLDNWEKRFFYYLVDTGRFMVCPPLSYSTNFSEPGTHVKNLLEENTYQTVLDPGTKLPEFKTLDRSMAVYDGFFELYPSRIKKLNTNLKDFDLEVDLYGSKPKNEIKKPYLLSSKKASPAESTFGRNLKPHELNIAHQIPGNDIYLARVNNFRQSFPQRLLQSFRVHYYYYPPGKWLKLWRILLLELFKCIFPGIFRRLWKKSKKL